MARTIQDIKRSMTDAFLADETLRERYGLQEGDTFEGRFSPVSLESILIYIVASAHYLLERLFDRHREEVSALVDQAVVATVPWYYRMARAYQHGDRLELNAETMRYEYPAVDESKRLIKYAAVRDRGNSIQMLVSGEQDGLPVPLPNDVLTAFEAYMKAIKTAGVVLSVSSLPADVLEITAEIQIDPMFISRQGKRLRDGAPVVEEAIRAYLKGIVYGGRYNKTKLVDAIQAVEGVVDVVLSECYATAHGGERKLIQGNNYTALSGSFLAPNLSNTLTYVV